jgi:mycothiol synthase
MMNSDVNDVTFRCFAGEQDYQAMIAVREESKEYDKVDPLSTLEGIPTVVELKEELHIESVDQYKDVLIAEVNGKVIGYNHIRWWREEDGTCCYLHLGYLVPQWRRKGIGSTMLHRSEKRIREIAKNQSRCNKGVFGSNASSKEFEKSALLLLEGYKPVWTLAEFEFTDFLHLPNVLLPEGFFIKPVVQEHLHMIYLANHEVYIGNWGNTTPSEEGFREFISNTDPTLWQVAWDKHEIAGFVLSEIRNGVGVVTEVSVREPWRRKKLAYSLLTKNLKELHKRGVSVVRLHTDAEGRSGARSLYEKIGFVHLKDFVRYRKDIL